MGPGLVSQRIIIKILSEMFAWMEIVEMALTQLFVIMFVWENYIGDKMKQVIEKEKNSLIM